MGRISIGTWAHAVANSICSGLLHELDQGLRNASNMVPVSLLVPIDRRAILSGMARSLDSVAASQTENCARCCRDRHRYVCSVEGSSLFVRRHYEPYVLRLGYSRRFDPDRMPRRYVAVVRLRKMGKDPCIFRSWGGDNCVCVCGCCE